jgi:phosphoglycolate phosphatase-like HAD superfamily hydrolase
MNLTEYLSHHPKKHLIFDFDRTLATLVIDWPTMLEKMFQPLLRLDHGLVYPLTPDTLSYPLFNTLIRKHGHPAKKIIESYFQKAEAEDLKGVKPNRELINFVKNHDEYDYYIWSNNFRATILKVLDEEKLRNRFKIIVAADDNLFYKPDATGMEKIAIGDKKDWLMIGDSGNDRLGASALGIDFYKVDGIS